VGRAIETEVRDSSTARVPSVLPGHAILFTRYDEEKSVVLHPDDYRRLVSLDEELAAIALPRPEMSELVLAAHRLEDTPGAPVEDAGEIRKLLDL
jgi:hypothetical protein